MLATAKTGAISKRSSPVFGISNGGSLSSMLTTEGLLEARLGVLLIVFGTLLEITILGTLMGSLLGSLGMLGTLLGSLGMLRGLLGKLGTLLVWLLLGVLLGSLGSLGTLLGVLLVVGGSKPNKSKWLMPPTVMVNVPLLLNVKVDVTFS